MPAPAPSAFALGSTLRLALAVRPRGGRAGGALGRAPGSSLEFEDRRAYVAGDDVRHVDWRALARTDQVVVRQHREEVTPVLELLVDDSASMGTDGAKAQLCVDVACVLASAARSGGLAVRMIRLGNAPELVEAQGFDTRGFDFTGRSPLGDTFAQAGRLLRPGTTRVLVSDFLSPHEPRLLVSRLAAGAGACALVQVLSAFDVNPAAGEALRLVDAESDASLNLVLDERTVAAYRQRLERWTAGLSEEARRVGGRMVTLEATATLEDAARGPLCARGVLEPA